MATFTGTYSQDIGRLVWKNIRLSINKYAQNTAEYLVQSAEQGLYAWKERTAAVLGDQLPESEWHDRRDPTRLFPYMNRGNQVRSIDAGVKYKVTGAGNYSISSWAKIGVPYAEFTSQGYRRRSDGVKPKWVGWMDDVFKGTRGFYSVKDVFERIALEREAFR